jgi:hypothetical protein
MRLFPEGDKWCDKCDKPLLSFNYYHLFQVSCDLETYFTFNVYLRLFLFQISPILFSRYIIS